MSFDKYLKTKGAIYEFGDYYSAYRNELMKILKYYQDKGYKTAIWGAGLKGTAFLSLIDPKGRFIQTVIDMNKELHGTMVTPRHQVNSLEDALKVTPDVVIIMNSTHYADNYSLLKEKNFNGIVLDYHYRREF